MTTPASESDNLMNNLKFNQILNPKVTALVTLGT